VKTGRDVVGDGCDVVENTERLMPRNSYPDTFNVVT